MNQGVMNDELFNLKTMIGNTYSLFFTKSLLMKSFPSADTLAKASSSKSQSQALTFFRVSMSFSPANGDKPLNLCKILV